jgi:hypothetical protein
MNILRKYQEYIIYIINSIISGVIASQLITDMTLNKSMIFAGITLGSLIFINKVFLRIFRFHMGKTVKQQLETTCPPNPRANGMINIGNQATYEDYLFSGCKKAGTCDSHEPDIISAGILNKKEHCGAWDLKSTGLQYSLAKGWTKEADCSKYDSQSSFLPDKCLKELWEASKCTNIEAADKQYLIWKKQNKAAIEKDLHSWKNLTDNTHRTLCYGADKSRWPTIESSNKIDTSKKYRLKAINSQKCLYNNRDGRFGTYQCINFDDQYWTLSAVPGQMNTYMFKGVNSYYSLYADTNGTFRTAKSNINDPTQQWELIPIRGQSDTYQLKNRKTSSCLYNNADGRFNMSGCVAAYNDQWWKLIPITSSTCNSVQRYDVVELGAIGISPWGRCPGFLSQSAKWIATSSSAVSAIAPGLRGYFIYEYENNNNSHIPSKLNVIADNSCTIELNNTIIGTQSGGWGGSGGIFPITIKPGMNRFIFRLVNSGSSPNPAGLLVAVVSNSNNLLFQSEKTPHWSYTLTHPCPKDNKNSPDVATSCKGWDCTIEGQKCPKGVPGAVRFDYICKNRKWVPSCDDCTCKFWKKINRPSSYEKANRCQKCCLTW